MSDGADGVRTVLVLDGGGGRGDLLGMALSHDIRVRIVADATDVLDLARTDPPDTIIVDATSDQNGPDVCRRLGADRFAHGLPIVVVACDEAAQIRLYDAGAADVVFPDVSPALLRSKITRLISYKKAQERLIQAERCARMKAEELESIVEMVAHDLKSPVVAVAGFVRMLHRRLATRHAGPAVNEILDHVTIACETMLALLKDLSEVLRADKIDFESAPVSLAEVIQEVVFRHQDLMDQRGTSVGLDLGAQEFFVLGDRRRIAQVATNLLVNAILHMGDPPTPAISIRIEEDRGSIVTHVSDNGVGVPSEFLERLFDRFFRVPGTTNRPGTGLGLSIAKSIVESHGGRIWVESRINHGTTFSFSLPRCSADATRSGPCSPGRTLRQER